MFWNSDRSGCLNLPPTPCSALTPGPLAPVTLPSWIRVLLLDVGRACTYRKWNELRPNPQVFCPSNVGPISTPQESDAGHWTKDLWITPGFLAVASPSPSLPHLKVRAISRLWRKTWLELTSDPVFSPKPLDTCWLYSNTTTQGYPSKNEIGNCFI